MDYERLKKLADAGDTEAAARLLAVAQRRADDRGAASAALTLGDADALLTLFAEAWKEGTWDQAQQIGQQLGLTFDEDLGQQLETLRQSPLFTDTSAGSYRLLSRVALLRVLYQARVSHHGIATTHAGAVPGQTVTSVALAVRRDGHVHVAVATSASRKPTPGTAWPSLRPWRKAMRSNLQRVERWLHQHTTVAIPLCEASQAVEQRAQDAHNPFSRLDALLSQPSPENWKALLTLLHHWPEAASRDAALERAARALEAWPDAIRQGGRAWLRSCSASTPSPHLELVRSWDAVIRRPHLERLAQLPQVACLRQMTLREESLYRRSDLPPALFEALWSSPHLQALNRLELRYLILHPRLLAALLASPSLAGLRTLRLISTFAFLEHQRAPHTGELSRVEVRALHTLYLENLLLTDEALALVLSAQNELRQLEIHTPLLPEMLGPRSARAISGWTHLERLVLRSCLMTREAMAALTLPSSLEHLELSLRSESAVGFFAVLRRSALDTLQHLELKGHFTLPGKALEVLTQLPVLRVLSLQELYIPHTFARALARSPLAGRLERLRVSPYLIEGRGLEELRTALGPALELSRAFIDRG